MNAPIFYVLSLFAGCGAYDHGLEDAGGFVTVAAAENNPGSAAIFAKHYPGVQNYGDVRTVTAARLAADGIAPNAIIAAWPCQDLSPAGPGGGLHGERSGLWSEVARLVGEFRPELVVLENSTELLNHGWLGVVLGDLAALGYDAEWDCIPASAVGAPHERDRIWIIAYPPRIGQSRPWGLFNALDPAPDAYREADRLVDAFQRGAMPFVCRGHDGAPAGLYRDRLHAIGNIGSPPCVIEQIGRAAVEAWS